MTKIIDVRLAIEAMSLGQETELLMWMMDRWAAKITSAGRPVASGPVPEWPAMGAVEEWWRGKLATGDLLPGRGWFSQVNRKDLAEDYSSALSLSAAPPHANASSMGKHIARLAPGLAITTTMTGLATPQRLRHYRFPALAICRTNFEAVYGPQDWREICSDGSGSGAGADCPNDEVPSWRYD